MYERNAIVIDRYFANIFGYDLANNIKNNSSNYFELVQNLESYQEVSEKENNIMQEFEKVANQIKETQRLQETLNKRNLKYNENIKNLFENLDEKPEILNKKFERLDEEITKNNEEIRINAGKFVEEIREFNEKSDIRNESGRERRIVENEYQKSLNKTIENINKIDKEKLKEIKTFIKSENKNDAKEEIRQRIWKNGSKEKVPFDTQVIMTAIDVSTDIEQKRAEIFLSLCDKTSKILDEIKNDAVKIDKHNKIVIDSNSKLEFLNTISEYVVLFLDNERMNTIGGEEEHQRIMGEACENLQKDLVQIQNMYSLLVKEITGKSSKKAYKELYNPDYLLDLQDDEKKFEKSISKLNMMGTVIYPDYWRLEGMQKIYDTFKSILTETYEKDLSEYEPIDIAFDVKEEVLEENTEEKTDSMEQEEYPEERDEINSEENNREEKKTSKSESEDEFYWDDEDEEDELNFGGSNYILSEDEEEEEKEEIESEEDDELKSEQEDNEDEEDQEAKREREIDEILGFFDDESSEDNDDELLNEEDDDEDNSKEEVNEKIQTMDLSGKIFDDEEEEKPKEESKKKKKSLFGRRKK